MGSGDEAAQRRPAGTGVAAVGKHDDASRLASLTAPSVRVGQDAELDPDDWGQSPLKARGDVADRTVEAIALGP
ncbi:hypothetical protein GCM10012320_00300 [Sinomonas cellulolyticus]|nr:hypothetical protein GCM10012320_00300 [Sinomonas sp. KCTC 49339]